MSLVYLIYAIGWFAASCWNWRELLRIQVSYLVFASIFCGLDWMQIIIFYKSMLSFMEPKGDVVISEITTNYRTKV